MDTYIRRLFVTDPGAMILVLPLSGGYLCRDTNLSPHHYVRNNFLGEERSILPKLLHRHTRNLMRTQTVLREFRERSIIQMRGAGRS